MFFHGLFEWEEEREGGKAEKAPKSQTSRFPGAALYIAVDDCGISVDP